MTPEDLRRELQHTRERLVRCITDQDWVAPLQFALIAALDSIEQAQETARAITAPLQSDRESV